MPPADLPPLTVASPDYAPAEVYCGLRDQALRMAAAQGTGPVAALMETGYPGAVATLVAMADGTTSVYLSTGGGVIGAGTHPPVATAAAAFLKAAAEHVGHMEPATAYPLPLPNCTRFYVLTATGTFTAEAGDDDLGHNREPLSPVFHLAHAVISAVREHAEPGP